MLMGITVIISLTIAFLAISGVAYKLLQILPSEWFYKLLDTTEDEITLPKGR